MLDSAARQAYRAGRRAARRAERASRRADRGRGFTHGWLPWPARLFFALLFTVGIVAVSIATQLVVPLVLRMLSLFMARRALAAAADAASHAGEVAVDGMRAARRWVVGGVGARASEDSPEPRVRVDPAAADAVNEEVEEAQADAEDGGESMRRPRQRPR